MSKFRYARSNGQFLESKFIDPVADATSQNFKARQSYDISKNFVSQSAGTPNSFTTETKLKDGYTALSTSNLGWFRLGFQGDSSPSLVEDSTGNGNWLTGSAGSAGLPELSSLTPSKYISNGSFYFDGTDNGVAAGDSGASFNFGHAGKDYPFTISCWIYSTSFSSTQYVVSKYNFTDSQIEYFVRLSATRNVSAICADEDAGGNRGHGKITDDGILTVNTWHHLVVTYDGSGDPANGVTIWLDGAQPNQSSLSYGGPGTYVSMRKTTAEFSISKVPGLSSSGFMGSIADVAVWNRVLSSSEILNLYGVSKSGAYQLVRDFSNISPDNDSRVLGVETRSRGFNVSSLPPDIGQQFKQGVNVNNFDELLDYTSFKIRPNSGLITTFNGEDVNQVQFNDCLTATTNLASGSSYSQVTLGSAGRLSQRISHMREQRDLGQREIYNNSEVYEDTLDLDPVAIIKKHPLALVLPTQLVCQTSDELMDGAIEPLIIRGAIDGSSIDMPYYAHDLRASFGGMTDAWLRSYVIVDGKDTDEDVSGVAPFLDATETFGKTDLPGAFSDDFAKIAPYVDYLNDRDKEYTTNGVSSTVADVLIHSSSWTDNDDRTYDKMAAHGFVFDNDPIGFDSIAYGGLKK